MGLRLLGWSSLFYAQERKRKSAAKAACARRSEKVNKSPVLNLAKHVAKVVRFGYNDCTEKGVILCQLQQRN